VTGTWPTSWSTGDVTLASEYRKGIGAISDTTLGGSAANVDIASIVGTYAHLLIFAYARGDTAATNTALGVRLNGDAAANYDYQQLGGVGTGVVSGEQFAQTLMSAGFMPANTAGANLFGAHCIFIPHYAGSTNNKVAVSISATKTGVTTATMFNYLVGAFWRSNAAINRITLLPAAGNFVAGTRVSLYGMGS
jgi:hypothetical protein